MAKSFRFPRWVEKTRTYSIHPVAFIDQPVATPHQPRYAQQLPPGGSQGGCAARVARLATPTERVRFCNRSQILKRTVGVANLATRSFRNNWVHCIESAHATSPWLPPGGSCHDEISASRNRYFVVTDEGWRWLKVSDFHVGWRKPGHIPSIQLHSLTNRSLPLISLFCQSVPKCRLPKNPASPRLPPRGRSHTLLPFIQPFSFVSFGRILSAPTVWVGKLLPFSERLSWVHFGRLRASPTWRVRFCNRPANP